jgi:hypothetical protein
MVEVVILIDGAAKVVLTAVGGVIGAGVLQAEKIIKPTARKAKCFVFIRVTSVFFHCRPAVPT